MVEFFLQTLNFPANSKEDEPFHCTIYEYCHSDCSIRDHLRHVPWDDIFKLKLSAAATVWNLSPVWNWFMYLSSWILVNPHSSQWFSSSFPAAIVHINHHFCLYQQNKSSESKVKSRRLLIVIKGFLKLSKFLVLIKKGLSLCRNLFHMTFGKLTIILSTLVNLLHLLYSTVLEMLPSASVQAKLFPKTVSDNSNIND